ENCVNELASQKTIPTNAGYQYWFADKNFLDDSRTLKLSVVDAGKATHVPHKHPEDEFFFVLEGQAEFYLNGKTKTVGPYTSLYCPPNSEHGIRNAGGTPLKYLVIKKYEPVTAATDEQEAQQTIKKMFDALSARDSVSLRNHCTAGAMFYEYGKAWTADSLIHKAITQNTDAAFKRTNKFDFIRTTVNKDVAWITYNLHSAITSGDKNFTVQWLETAVLVKHAGKWKINVLHSTRINDH
ncbi:MAG TPA: cupin domain-containing protein, partial [Cyclobacteriaceae bacterium]|nr:cupin domain-containing protein [Cyclobacteriaceae bacterium]